MKFAANLAHPASVHKIYVTKGAMADSKLVYSLHGERRAFLKALNDSLKELYKRETVQLAGTSPDVKPKAKTYTSQTVMLNDVYVKLHILAKAELKRRVGNVTVQGSVGEMMSFAHAFSEEAKGATCIELGDILQLAADERFRVLKKKGARVLALAGAGVGKTVSFLKKASLEWAQGEIWSDMEFVFALALRQPLVHSARTLEELLALEDHGFHRRTDREEICDYISKNLSRVCFILDGLDEVDLCKCSDFVVKVIKGISLNGVRLIVTSRPSVPVIELAKSNPFNLRLEVLGFSHEELASYVGKVLNPEDAEALMRQVTGNPQLSAFMQVPANAANACSLYRSGVKLLPLTLPAITTAILRQVLVQAEEKKETPRFVADKWSEINPVLLEPVKELAAFAFRTLVDNVTVFEKRHFDDHLLSPDALSLGMLVACDNIRADATPQWVFSHLIMHEALAAYHIASTISTEDVPWLVETLGALTGHLNTFWRFLAAQLDSMGADSLLSSLFLTSGPEPSATQPHSRTAALDCPPILEGSYHTYFLSANHADMYGLADRLSQNLKIDQGHRLAEHLLAGVVSGSGRQAVESTIRHQGKILTGAIFLAELLLLWKSRVPRSSAYLLRSAIASFDQSAAANCFPDLGASASCQAVKRIDSAAEAGKHILLLACHCYQEFRASKEHSSSPPVVGSCNGVYCGSSTSANATAPTSTHTHYDSGVTATSTRRSCKQVSPLIKFRQALCESGRFDLSDIYLVRDDCRAVGCVLRDFHANISHLDITHASIGDSGYEQLASGLDMCRRLTGLCIELNKLTDKVKDHIAKVIRNNSATMKNLKTSLNHFTSIGNAAVHSNTWMCGRLRGLAMGGSLCTDIDVNVSTLRAVLPLCPHLHSVQLMQYGLGLGGLKQLHALLLSHRLKMLVLGENELAMNCIPTLKLLLLQHHQNLSSLSITRNDLTDAFLVETEYALRSCVFLREVWLRGIGISSQGLQVLAAIVRDWPNLGQLVLTNNDFKDTDEGSGSFGFALLSCQYLYEVCMPDKKFVHAELRAALATVARLNSGISLNYGYQICWESEENVCPEEA